MHLVSTAVLITCPQLAKAQSSVTLSGLLGSGVSYTTNAGAHGSGQYQLNGTHAVPFFAMSGKEMLDGDTAAVFRLSKYAFLDTGISTPFESFVALSSNSKGTVSLGSMYDLLADLVPFTSERYTSLLATHPGNLDRTVGNSLNSTVKYKSPVLGGLQFGAMYAFGSASSTTNAGRAVGGEISYANGPIQTIFVWESVNGVPYAPALKLGITRLYGIDFSKTPTASVLQSQNTATAGIAYADEGWRVMGNYSYTRLSAAGVRETAQSVDVGAYKYVTPQTRIGGGYSYTSLDPYKWNQFHAHLDYALSKRTSLYVLGVLQVAGSGQLAVMRNQAPATASRQMVVEAGITHLF
ncbi:porin [Cupriavidus sp. D39]|uniref:porin n=1 Tax=Cupriavidus sp. D39 TaxID=2997877 RepID=UPI002270C3A0|nr:porin [Cupriavidus sp. D39]MCY0854102.1 porin [Cupriavidus sp. D39]